MNTDITQTQTRLFAKEKDVNNQNNQMENIKQLEKDNQEL